MKPIEEYVRSIPDFPESGIIFRDVTSRWITSGDRPDAGKIKRRGF